MDPTISSYALKLHTDLTNLRDYSDRPSVQVELVCVAEERIHRIMVHLASVRASLGMAPNGLVIEG